MVYIVIISSTVSLQLCLTIEVKFKMCKVFAILPHI